jgi:xanthine dehydrogenase accessory factor
MNPQQRFHERLGERLHRGEAFVVVTIVHSHGSTPADTGSRMIVTEEGIDFGTVGGGRIEAKAIDEAAQMLRNKAITKYVDWSLKTDVGMTCGGRVKLYFELWNATPWNIVIFGAGHVTQALARLLTTLNCRLTCIDPRQDWIEKLPAGVHTIVDEQPASVVDKLPENSFVLCMTKGHHSDLPVLQRIFEIGRRFPYLGVIGSNAKAAVLRKELVESGIAKERLSFHCPIGLFDGNSPIGNHDPNEIAVSIAAQLIRERDRLRSKESQLAD